MTSHPHRRAGPPARNPSPAEVRAAREVAGLTQTEAAALVHASTRNWQQWEQEEGSNARRMHPGLWELFGVKAGLPMKRNEMDKHQIEAICQMAEATHDYNRGVLWALGHHRLALAHESACKWVEMLVAERDLLIPEGASPLDPLPPEAEKKQQEIDRERAHRDATWAPIQAIIDEARRLRDEADPMGMGQAV